MDELRLVRRDEQSLIVATEAGDEFRLIVDEAALAEFRYLSRPERGTGKVNPRAVQSMLRAGKSRAEVAEAMGLDESDVERYEEPVLAERRYILELARAVPVRTNSTEESEEQFGAVIAERLIGLDASGTNWSAWRDDEAGWMVGLDFESHSVSHRAVWSFDHRKNLLTPVTADATTLSKQGDLGDRLIPKLRAVDSDERFDSGAFDVEKLRGDASASEDGDSTPGAKTENTDGTSDSTAPNGRVSPDHPSTGAIPVVDAGEEYARRQLIEERAIKSPEPELPDLGETADLLDALRRRRGEREAADDQAEPERSAPIPIGGEATEAESEPSAGKWEIVEDDAGDTAELNGIRDLEDTRIAPNPGPRLVDPMPEPELSPDADADANDEPGRAETRKHAAKSDADSRRRGKGRAAIPSWDDILFGTRSEDDPA